jgi:hypothetical protein
VPTLLEKLRAGLGPTILADVDLEAGELELHSGQGSVQLGDETPLPVTIAMGAIPLGLAAVHCFLLDEVDQVALFLGVVIVDQPCTLGAIVETGVCMLSSLQTLPVDKGAAARFTGTLALSIPHFPLFLPIHHISTRMVTRIGG